MQQSYLSYTTKTLASGEVRKYPVIKKYTVTRTNKISDDIKTKILNDHSLGIPSSRIAIDLNLNVTRVRRLIRKWTQVETT